MGTCGEWGVCLVSWRDDRPAVTVVVRCDPVVRGPDVPGCGPDVAPTVTNSENSNPGRRLVLLRPMLE